MVSKCPKHSLFCEKENGCGGKKVAKIQRSCKSNWFPGHIQEEVAVCRKPEWECALHVAGTTAAFHLLDGWMDGWISPRSSHRFLWTVRPERYRKRLVVYTRFKNRLHYLKSFKGVVVVDSFRCIEYYLLCFTNS